MGQGVSEFPSSVSDLTDGIKQSTQILREVVLLSYEEFLIKVGKLNEISQTFSDASGTQLVFVVKKGSDASVLWKSTVRISCIRVDPLTRQIISHRLLKLRQFLKLYSLLSHHVSASQDFSETQSDAQPSEQTRLKEVLNPSEVATSHRTRSTITSSFIFKRLDSLAGEEGTDLTECCICMERKPDITLPCTHSYCLPCIEQWNVTNKTCPICREELLTTDDSWVISEAPDSHEVATEVRRALDRVARKPIHTLQETT